MFPTSFIVFSIINNFIQESDIKAEATAATNKEYTYEEVAQHNTADDLWFVIHKKVYDVTKFQHDYPGGNEVLVDNSGIDEIYTTISRRLTYFISMCRYRCDRSI